MHFIVDTVSEFTYFQNILLGLADALYKRVGVKRTYLKKFAPLTNAAIAAWENEEKVLLPDDFRLFYSSSDGYLFEWNYAFGDVDEKVLGKIEINSLAKTQRVYGYETTNDPGVSLKNGRYVIRLAPESRIYELSLLPERGKVVLVYLYPEYIPSIWLLTTTMNFYYLADNITTYLRMAIAHLGIPNWQLAYTPEGIPQWTENMFRMIAPNLLPLNVSLEKMKRYRRKRKDNDYIHIPVNRLNSNLFLLLPRPDVPDKQAVPLITPAEPENLKQIIKKKTASSVVPPRQFEPTHNVRTPRKFRRKPLYFVKKR